MCEKVSASEDLSELVVTAIADRPHSLGELVASPNLRSENTASAPRLPGNLQIADRQGSGRASTVGGQRVPERGAEYLNRVRSD